MIEFGYLREFHLERDWSNQAEEEERMAFENLVFIIENYFRHGYRHVIVNDLKESKVRELREFFKNNSLLVTLTANDAVLRDRIASRSEGFTNVEAASAWNSRVAATPIADGEISLDSSKVSIDESVGPILAALNLGRE